MQRFVETVDIAVAAARVWRALTLPAEVACWDTGIVEPIDAPPDYPRAGQYVRWRYRIGPLPLILHDRPSRVEPCRLLRSSIRLGPFEFDETYTLHSKHASSTQLSADLYVTSRVPVLGFLLERIAGKPLAQHAVQASLAAIRYHCETTP